MTAPAIREIARAKINLALHVTGRRDDGYHELDSLVAFADVGDELTLSAADASVLDINGRFAAALEGASGNIVLSALEAVQQQWPQHCGDFSITLEKNLPVASGIGGGSADAAAVLRALQQVAGTELSGQSLQAVALSLGADVPVCLQQRPCRMRGIGEELELMEGFPALSAVLVNPGVEVSTPAVFNALGLEPGQPAFAPMPDLPLATGANDWISWLHNCRNDLQTAAQAVAPEIGEVLHALAHSNGCCLHRMSGSGATCFALYEDQQAARSAADDLATEHPAWWVRAAKLN